MNESLFADLYETEDDEDAVSKETEQESVQSATTSVDSGLFDDLYESEKTKEPVEITPTSVDDAVIQEESTLFSDLYEADTVSLQSEDPTDYDLDVEKTFDEFAADQGYIDSIEEYAVSRYGQEGGARQEGE